MNIRCLLGHKWKPVLAWRWDARPVWFFGWGSEDVYEAILLGDWWPSGHKCTRCGARRKA